MDLTEPDGEMIVWAASARPHASDHPSLEHRGPFVSRLFRYPGKGDGPSHRFPRSSPSSTRPWGRTPVRAIVDGIAWDTSVWRDSKTDRALLAAPARVRGRKGDGDSVTVESTFESEGDD